MDQPLGTEAFFPAVTTGLGSHAIFRLLGLGVVNNILYVSHVEHTGL